MANIFSQLLGGLFGQSDIPSAYIPSEQDVLGSALGSIPQIAQGTVDYNRLLAPGLMQAQLDVERMYDPNQGRLRQATTQSILDQLNLGSAIPRDVQDQVIRNALEGSTASGFGVTPGGRGLVARDLGLTSLDLLNQRIGTARQAVQGAPLPGQLFQPQGIGITPGNVADLYLGAARGRNDYNTFVSQMEAQNAKNLWEQPLNLAASAYGSYTGAKALGGITGGGGGGGGGGVTWSGGAPTLDYRVGADQYQRRR